MNKSTPFGFSQNIIDQLISVFKQYPEIQSVLLYGSRAKGNFRPGSDIDLAIIAPDLSFNSFAGLCSKIEDLPLIFKIDCVHLDHLKKEALINNIQTEGKKIY